MGVALFAVAALVWCLTQESPPAQTGGTAEPDAGIVERSTALVEPELEIPELEPDAGPPPDAGVLTHVPPTKRPPGTTQSWESCTGDIQAADARRVIHDFESQIRNCYERRLKANPLLQGSIQLAVRIAPDGHVDGTQVSGTLHDREVFACVRNVASHMRFPAPGGHDCALVQVPFSFSPRE